MGKKHNIWNNIYLCYSGGVAETLRKQFGVWLPCAERLRLSLVPIMYFSAAHVCVFSADLPTQALPLLLHSKLTAVHCELCYHFPPFFYLSI